MKALAVVAGVALIAVVGDIVLLMRRPAPVAAPVHREEKVVEEPVRRPPPPTVAVRAQIRKVVEEERPKLLTTRDVDRYLDDLKVRARRNRQVTALEVEPGLAAIQSQYPPDQAMERVQEFAKEMEKLSAELDGFDRQPPPPDVDSLQRNIERAGDEDRRQDLIRQYLQVVHSLPPDDQQQRLAWLNLHAAH